MNSTTETTVGKLTANDLKALRKADSVHFYYRGSQVTNGAAESKACASKRIANPEPFERSSIDWEFDLPAEHRGKGIKRDTLRASGGVSCAQFHEEWRTVADLLKVGDELTAVWYANCENNGYVDRAVIGPASGSESNVGEGMGLHADCLFLLVKRGKKTMKFLIECRICPDNTARMLKQG